MKDEQDIKNKFIHESGLPIVSDDEKFAYISWLENEHLEALKKVEAQLNDGWKYSEDGVPKDREIIRYDKVHECQVQVSFIQWGTSGLPHWDSYNDFTKESDFIKGVWRETTAPNMELIKEKG